MRVHGGRALLPAGATVVPFRVLGAGLALALMPVPARACGQCVFALWDQVLPPIAGWSIFAITWTLAVAATLGWTRTSLPGLPGAPWHLVFLIAGVFISSIFGPLTIVPLMLLPLIATVRTLQRSSTVAPPVQRIIRGIGALHGVAALALLGVLAWTLSTRTPEDTVIRWGGTSPARHAMRVLREREPASLDAYRRILREGTWPEVGKAAHRLAAIGDPVADRAVLQAARVRLQHDRYAVDDIDEALVALSER